MCKGGSLKKHGGKDFPSPADWGGALSYTLRRSAKARRVSLRVLPGKGLEVVLPEWADSSMAPDLLRRHKSWIDKSLGRLRKENAGMPVLLPSVLLLRGGAEELGISVEGESPFEQEPPADPGGGEPSGVFPPRLPGARQPLPLRRELVLPKEDLPASLMRLRERLREEARLFLGQRLDALCREHGLRYAKLSVRFQKSRWGSCSMRKGISLNAGLLFLPDRLSDYILRHELCHTRHMNHSQDFWKLLFALDPDALAHDRAMRGAWRHVPQWLYML